MSWSEKDPDMTLDTVRGKHGRQPTSKLGGLTGEMQTAKDASRRYPKARSTETSYSSGPHEYRATGKNSHSTLAERSREESRERKYSKVITPGEALSRTGVRSGCSRTSCSSAGCPPRDSLAQCLPTADQLIRKKHPSPSPAGPAVRTESSLNGPSVPVVRCAAAVQHGHSKKSNVPLQQRRAVAMRSRHTEKNAKEPEIILIDEDDDDDDNDNDEQAGEKVQPIVNMRRRIGKDIELSNLEVDSKALELPLSMVFIGTEHFEYTDTSKKCQLIVDRGEWILCVPDKWTELGTMRTKRGMKRSQLELSEALDTDLITNITCGTKLGPDQNNVAFIALQMDPAVSLSLPVLRQLPSEGTNGSSFCPENRESMSPNRYILLVASDEVVESLVNYIDRDSLLREKLEDLNKSVGDGHVSLCFPYLAAYLQHMGPKEDTASSRRQARRAKRKSVVYDDEEAARALFRYPMEENAVDTIMICVGDVRRLTEGEFLNDNLIDLQVKRAVLETGKLRAGQQAGAVLTGSCTDGTVNTAWSDSHPLASAKHKSLPVYAFSSMFYSKLTEVDDRTQAYTLVKRWTKNVDIFSKDFVFIPINIGAHWSLTCVVRPGALMTDEERNQQISSVPAGNASERVDPGYIVATSPFTVENDADLATRHRTCILILDSLGLHSHRKIGNRVTDYLIQELRHKKQITRAIEKRSIPVINCTNIPKQENSYDCGVYVTLYAKMICDAYPSSTQTDIENKFASHFSKVTFTQTDVDEERARIREFCEECGEKWQVVQQQREKKRRESEVEAEGTDVTRRESTTHHGMLVHSDERKGPSSTAIHENGYGVRISPAGVDGGVTLSYESEAKESFASEPSPHTNYDLADRKIVYGDNEEYVTEGNSRSSDALLQGGTKNHSLSMGDLLLPEIESDIASDSDRSSSQSCRYGSLETTSRCLCERGTKRPHVAMSSSYNSTPESSGVEPNRRYRRSAGQKPHRITSMFS